jgi:hypothetical protein
MIEPKWISDSIDVVCYPKPWFCPICGILGCQWKEKEFVYRQVIEWACRNVYLEAARMLEPKRVLIFVDKLEAIVDYAKVIGIQGFGAWLGSQSHR